MAGARYEVKKTLCYVISDFLLLRKQKTSSWVFGTVFISSSCLEIFESQRISDHESSWKFSIWWLILFFGWPNLDQLKRRVKWWLLVHAMFFLVLQSSTKQISFQYKDASQISKYPSHRKFLSPQKRCHNMCEQQDSEHVWIRFVRSFGGQENYIKKKHIVGGNSNICCHFHLEQLGKMNPFWLQIFQMGGSHLRSQPEARSTGCPGRCCRLENRGSFRCFWIWNEYEYRRMADIIYILYDIIII